MAARVHRPPGVIPLNADGIWIQRYELIKQLQDFTSMRLCSQRHVSNPMRGSSFEIIAFVGLTAFRE
jgi:hypothetical protein